MKKRLTNFINKSYADFLFYSIFLVAMIYMASVRGFWYDELTWTIRFVHNHTIMQTLQELAQSIYNLPLYYVVLNLLYRISDNQIWLRIPSIVATLGAAYYILKIVNRYYKTPYHVLTLILLMIVPLSYTALEVRPYGFLLFFAAWAYDLYLEHWEKDDYKNLLKFGVVLTLLAYSHWYGGLLIAAFGLTDFYLWLCKKVKFRNVIPYAVCGLLFLPWIICLIMCHKYDFLTYWAGQKHYSYIIAVFRYFTQYTLLCMVFIISLFYALLKLLNNMQKYITKPYSNSAFIIFFIWTVVWAYSIINPKGSIIEIRYFYVFLPQIILVIIGGIRELMAHKNKLLKRADKKSNLWLCICSPVVIVFVFIAYLHIHAYNNRVSQEFYEYDKYFDIVRNTQKLYPKPLLNVFYEEMFLDYYMEKDSKMNIISFNMIDNYDAGRIMHKYKSNIISKIMKLDCQEGYKYIMHLNKKSPYYIVKNGQKSRQLFKENICNYDVVFVDNKTLWSIAYLKVFLDKHYEKIGYFPYVNSDMYFVYKYTKKKQRK